MPDYEKSKPRRRLRYGNKVEDNIGVALSAEEKHLYSLACSNCHETMSSMGRRLVIEFLVREGCLEHDYYNLQNPQVRG
jgi:hypothetical protein